MPTAHRAEPFGPEVLARGLGPLLGPPPADGTALSVIVALSGGADSVALLSAAAALAAAEPRLRVTALHVDHGLDAAAPLAAAARAAAAALGVKLRTLPVTVARDPGASLEAAARDARHAAFAAALAPGECLLTAHHREDQAETLLLQLLRGAGLPGLAAMPAEAPLGAGRLLRPLLGVSRAALRAYAAASGLPWHEDPMNRAARFDRSYLRERLWPLIEARWPAAAVTLGRAARHAATAQQLLDADSRAALATLERGPALDVAAFSALGPARRIEVLRYWLRVLGLPLPSTRRLAGLEREVLAARPGAAPRLAWQGGELSRYDDCLYAFAPLPPARLPEPAAVPAAGELALGALGRIVVRPATGRGIAAAAAPLSFALRRGGERLQLAPGGHPRPLKDWLREARVPPWARERALLVRADAVLVAVVLPHATWIDARWQAGAGAAGRELLWQDAPAVLKPLPFIER